MWWGNCTRAGMPLMLGAASPAMQPVRTHPQLFLQQPVSGVCTNVATTCLNSILAHRLVRTAPAVISPLCWRMRRAGLTVNLPHQGSMQVGRG